MCRFGGSWLCPRPSHLSFHGIPHPLCIYPREAATLSQPLEVPDLGSRSPGCGPQGGIPRSSRAPGFPDSPRLTATPPDGGMLSPWWPHYDELVAAAPNACISPGWSCAFPPHPGAGRGRWACFHVSLTVTADVSLAYTFYNHLCPQFVPPRSSHHLLPLFPWEQVHQRWPLEGHWS